MVGDVVVAGSERGGLFTIGGLEPGQPPAPQALAVVDELAGLGQTSPNPVLSTLRHFREEYEAHIYEKRCPAGVCQALVRAPCVNECPAGVDSPAYLALVAQGHAGPGQAIGSGCQFWRDLFRAVDMNVDP